MRQPIRNVRGILRGLCVALALGVLPAAAQMFSFSSSGMSGGEVKGTMRVEPADLVVGEPFAFVLELEVDAESGVENLRVDGLPEAGADSIVYGEVENLADGKTAAKGKALKRFRLPARINAPFARDLAPSVSGMVVVRRQNGGMSFSSSASFGTRLGKVWLEAKPLPVEGRPPNFSGAVGKDFRMVQRVSADHVHPGDLVTATYALYFDGYCPSNAVPAVERLSREFKAYAVAPAEKGVPPPPRPFHGGPMVRAWTQVLVPRTAAATNTALVSLGFYNVATRRYETAIADPLRLSFVSTAAASTSNTLVTVDAPAAAIPRGQAAGSAPSTGPLVLRFAPSDRSPVVATPPVGTPVTELGRSGAWRRVATPRAIGWTR